MAKNSLLYLPLELLQMVASHLDDTASISRLCRSNRLLFEALERYLYRYDAVLASGNRCKALLATVAESALDTDARVSVAQKSLEAGADADFCVDFNFKYSHSLRPEPPQPRAAVARGCLPLVQVLVGFKADINRRTEGHELAPIGIAVLKSWTDGFLFLLSQPAIDLSASEEGHFGLGSVFHIAVSFGRLEIVKMLVPCVNPSLYDDPWIPPIRLAVSRRDGAMVSFLLSCEHVHVNALRKVTRIVFYESPKRTSTDFEYTCRHGTLSMVKLLHDDSRVDVDRCNDPENPPASSAEVSIIADFLIESRKFKTARDYIFRQACAREQVKPALKVVRLAEDHDKKYAKRWIEVAELYGQDHLARSIRKKWSDL